MSAGSTDAAATPAEGAVPGAPGLWRRMACFVYEGVLLFGVLMISGWLFSTLTQQRHALLGRHGLQGFLFLVLGIYFIWFWTHGGQTVAMKAWHSRLVDRHGAPVSQMRAFARYVAAYVGLLPAVVVSRLNGWTGWSLLIAIAIGIAAWAMLALLHPQRQFWHDALCGTRLVTWRPPSPRQNPGP